jgi:hypothetical protein
MQRTGSAGGEGRVGDEELGHVVGGHDYYLGKRFLLVHSMFKTSPLTKRCERTK